MKQLLSIASALLLACAVVAAHADTVSYLVTVNTSSQAGNGGYMDLTLAAGTVGVVQDITATVTGFNGATLNPADPNNETFGTTGSLPGPLSFDNQVSNDYFEARTFGNQLSFFVTLSGDGVSASGVSKSDSGTSFLITFFDPSISSFLFSNAPDGVAAEIDVAPEGTVTTSAQPGSTVAATPEPATLSLLGMGSVLVGIARRRMRAA